MAKSPKPLAAVAHLSSVPGWGGAVGCVGGLGAAGYLVGGNNLCLVLVLVGLALVSLKRA